MKPGTLLQIETRTIQSTVKCVAEDLCLMERQQTFPVPTSTIDVFATWFLAFADLAPGQLRIRTGSGLIDFSEKFNGPIAIFLPAFTLIEWNLAPGTIHWSAMCSPKPLPNDAPRVPMIFKSPGKTPRTTKEVADCLARAENPVTFQSERYSSSTAMRTKAYIDGNFKEDLKIQSVGAALRISWGVMSREFNAVYGLSPVAYRNKLRIMEAVRRIYLGENLTTALLEVGFSTQGRFIEQFRSQLGVNPSHYKASRAIRPRSDS